MMQSHLAHSQFTLFNQENQVIPPTKNGMSSMACLSALQKCIRRGLEREAMQFAIELMHTRKASFTMVTNRLMVICQEDIDNVAQPEIFPFIFASMAQAQAWYNPDPFKLGKARLAIGNSIRMLSRAKKSREGDHFQAAVAWASILEGFVPVVPDWVNDSHTQVGRRLGRGLDYFRAESTKLVPPAEKDAYEDEAYRLWALKDSLGAKATPQQAEIDENE